MGLKREKQAYLSGFNNVSHCYKVMSKCKRFNFYPLQLKDNRHRTVYPNNARDVTRSHRFTKNSCIELKQEPF